jgi:hypothetical protein
MSAPVKNGLLLVALVAIVGAAGFFFSRGDKEKSYPADGPKTLWMCDKCNHEFLLSPAEYKDWYDSQDKRRRDPNYPGGTTVFFCPDCQKFSVVRAMRSPSGKIYITKDSEGKSVDNPEIDKEIEAAG